MLTTIVLTDYVHTVIILVIIFIFAFSAYATNEVAGSPGKVWELLVDASRRHPVEGNAEGSYLTMKSREGAVFFVINIVGNFGTVFLDNGKYPPNLSSTADLRSSRLLQQSDRCVSSGCSPRLCDGWSLLVCDTMALRDHHGPHSSGTGEQSSLPNIPRAHTS